MSKLIHDEVVNEYFEWIYRIVCDDRFAEDISFRKLLMRLHDIEFAYTIRRDENRAADGINLRHRFAVRSKWSDVYKEVELTLNGPCSVLEMMVALSIRCEENIMDNTAYGDRTGQWFWGMVNNLGLGDMDDKVYDKRQVDDIIVRFLNREYDRDGKGGLFRVKRIRSDMRKAEIWHQMCWYLDSIGD